MTPLTSLSTDAVLSVGLPKGRQTLPAGAPIRYICGEFVASSTRGLLSDKSVHDGSGAAPDHHANLNCFHDLVFAGPTLQRLMAVVLQTFLAVDRNRDANRDEFQNLHGQLCFFRKVHISIRPRRNVT